jgi:glyoxylase-like metal-dependent hydrolase (beta-lactamase superfamily II)
MDAKMQIIPHIHALKIPFIVPTLQGAVPRFVYVYLVYGDEVCLIDSGVASSQNIIFDYMMKTARRPEEISQLILTHSHPDHMGAALAVKKATCCSVAAHQDEKAWIEDAELQARERPVPGFFSLVEGSVKVDRCLQDGIALDLGGIEARVIHTPGHSPGSVSLWFPEEDALISADAVPVPGDLPIYEDFRQSADSIRRLMAIDGIRFLLSSWDEPQQGEEARRALESGLLYLQRIHQAVLQAASKGSSLDPLELASVVLKELGIAGGLANPLVARSLQSHLMVIEKEDRL